MERRPTRGEAILAAVRNDILSGQLAPGMPLQFAEMTRRYGASTGVLREVLPRLVEQGLVTTQPQLGFRVVDVTVPELEHLTEARIAIETLVFEQSIRSGDLNWEAAVVSTKHRLIQTRTFLDDGTFNPDWLDVHRQFHEVLLEGCPNPRLRELAQRLRDVTEVYRCWAFRSTDGLSARDTEHEELAELAVSRNAEAGCESLHQHIQRSTDALIASYRRHHRAPVASGDGVPIALAQP